MHVLPVKGEPKSLLTLNESEVNSLREPLLRPVKVAFKAPNRVGLYLFSDGSWVTENFTDAVVSTELNGVRREIPARGWAYDWKGRTR